MTDQQSRSGMGIVPQEGSGREAIWPRPWTYLMLAAFFVIITAMAGYHYAVRGLKRLPADDPFLVPAADPERGRAKIRDYGCIGCHTIPGIAGADGRVGPRLDRLREPAYIAGVLPNSPQNLAAWIQRPRDIDPRTARPTLGVAEADARDMAAYLYSVSDEW